MSTEFSVALVYQQAESSVALRAALANAGVRVAFESRADSIDSQGILSSGVDAIVVNLDSELDDLLDLVTDALETASQPVIFNDPEASSDLSGWDRARWLRHLSAKLKGGSNVTPPPPPDAQSIPEPKRPVATTATLTRLADEIVAPPVTQRQVPAKGPLNVVGALGNADSDDTFANLADINFDAPALALPITREVPVISAAQTVGDSEIPLDEFLFGPSPMAAPTTAQSSVVDDLSELDALFAEPTLVEVSATASDPLPNDVELFDAPSSLADVTQSGSGSSDLADLDALFAELSGEPTPIAISESKATRTEPKAVEAPIEWSLEPVEMPEELPKTNVGKTVAEWRLDAPSKPLVSEMSQSPKPPAKPIEKTLPPQFEESLALADLKLFDEPEKNTASVVESEAQFSIDTLDFSADFDFDTKAESGSVKPAPTNGDDLALSDLDFALDFSADEPNAGDLALVDDFDGLFASNSPTPVLGLSLPDLNRVFVLGASIGGPEAIKAFLAKLTANTAAAFVVAQHMGAEFLEMMAMQLDAATPLSVRYPKNGERLKHGEVVVAPAGEELRIDDSGCIRLSPIQSNSPYSPSIDQIVRDAADRFGDQATLVLFSGMGGDAVEGARYLGQRGGETWVQDRKSCVIASMIDAAKAQGVVRFEGSADELAERVNSVLS